MGGPLGSEGFGMEEEEVVVTAMAVDEPWLNELSLFFQDQSPSRPTTQPPNCRR